LAAIALDYYPVTLFSERVDLVGDPERSNKLILDQPKS